jgi:hypothetical protein
MRSICPIVVGLALASCATQPPPPRTAQAQVQLDKLIAGKRAGAPITCLQHYRADDMVRIDDSTIAFRQGSRVYVNHLNGECSNLSNSFYALVTKGNGMGLCHGDIAEVRDVQTGTLVGACGLGDFIPYSRPS